MNELFDNIILDVLPQIPGCIALLVPQAVQEVDAREYELQRVSLCEFHNAGVIEAAATAAQVHKKLLVSAYQEELHLHRTPRD